MSGRIETHIFSTQGLENLMRDAILGRLGEDKDALKEINVDVIEAGSIPEAMELAKFPRGLFKIHGYLALDDSGIGMKYFEVNVEQGLPEKKDKEIADQLAFTCFACVHKMKRERKQNPNKFRLHLH